MKPIQIKRYGKMADSRDNKLWLTNFVQFIDQDNIVIMDKTFSINEAGKAFDYQKDVHIRQSSHNLCFGKTFFVK